MERRQRRGDRRRIVGRSDDACAGLLDQRCGSAVLGHDGEDRPLGRQVLEDLAGQHALATAVRLRDQEQQRLRLALELERTAPRDEVEELEPVAKAEPFGPLAVGWTEVADEARLDVEP